MKKMAADSLEKVLRFYFITDDRAPKVTPLEQVRIALSAGATIVQYRCKSFSARLFQEAAAVRDLCRCNRVPFVVNDNILLAKALEADGVHLGQDDEDPHLARAILGPRAIVGLSVSNLVELEKSDLAPCDYIGTGPVFDTSTKPDAKSAVGLSGLEAVVERSPVPVVAIGGIDATNAKACLARGAGGVAVISVITRAENPLQNALLLASACACLPRERLDAPWSDEFALIEALVTGAPTGSALKVPPGDDACLMEPLTRPVVTTDTQREGVHFRFEWQTPREVGAKAVDVAFSDLAASYAVPVALFVNLSLPANVSDRLVKEIYEGIRTALGRHGGGLAGGNISAADRLALDLFAVGQGHDALFPARSAARPGYGLYCTGPLGMARAGLESLIRKDPSFEQLVAKFKFPSARFDAARVLADQQVPCVIDISDGLAGDARHIAEASGLSIEFDFSRAVIDPELASFCRKYGLDAEAMILAGGEDYELLFACAPPTFEAVKNRLPGAFAVGRCLEFGGKHLVNLRPGIASFQHGRR